MKDYVFDDLLSDARFLEFTLHSLELPAQRLAEFARSANLSEYDQELTSWLRAGKFLCRHFIEESRRRILRSDRGNRY